MLNMHITQGSIAGLQNKLQPYLECQGDNDLPTFITVESILILKENQ